MTRIPLTLAVMPYDHVADVVSGRIPVEGVDLTWLNLHGLEIFHRFIKYREWEVSEMSTAKYVSLLSQGDRSLTAIPVFPSRMFRHTSIWVRDDGPTDPTQLAGLKIGVSEWAQTAVVYMRGLLMDEYGLELDSVEWFQAAAYELGRMEKVELALPPGVTCTRIPDRTLGDMLVAGDLDVVLSSEPPKAFLSGSGKIRRLFPDPVPLERDYYSRTGVYPIMHTICLRRDVFEQHPWVAMNLLVALEEAKNASLERLRTFRRSPFPLPWAAYYAQDAAELFGTDDFWPYGVDANRTTLETFLRFAHEQGVTHRKVSIDEMFPDEVGTRFKQ